MKVTWLGQAGLLLETEQLKIMIDPYLSDSVARKQPLNYRRIPVQQQIFEAEPDVMIFTHCHQDHYDPETVERFLNKSTERLVLAPASVWNEVRKTGGSNNYVQFDRHTSWTERAVRFTAVKAEHNDCAAIGVVIEDAGRNYYVTGDTLYNEEIFGDLPEQIWAVFLPINGVGNNMNGTDAARFAKRIHAQHVIPVHIGMFDEKRPEEFVCENRLLLEVYKTIQL